MWEVFECQASVFAKGVPYCNDGAEDVAQPLWRQDDDIYKL